MNIFINEKEQRPRAGWRLFMQLVCLLAIYGIGSILILFLLPSSLMLSSAIPMFFGVTFSVWIAARYFDRRPLSAYGIYFNRTWVREFIAGTVIAAAAQGILFLVEWSAGWITITHFGWEATTQPSFGAGITMFFCSMLLVGVYEELFSRGYHIINLTEGLSHPSYGRRGALAMAVLLSSSLFGFLHFFNPNASLLSTFNIILAGIVLAIPYLVTGSLALSAGLHFSWNFVMAGILGFPVSGQAIKSSVLKIQQGGSEWITGGAFGPEAGLIGWLAMGLLLLGSYFYVRQAGYELTIDEKFTKKYEGYMKPDEQSA